MKRRAWTLEEINIWRKKYGNPIRTRELLSSLLVPFIILFLMALIFYHNIWISTLFGFLAALFTFRYTMPAQERRSYEMKDINERNRFMNNLSSMLKDGGTPVVECLSQTAELLNGELQKNVELLVSHAQGKGIDEVQNAFQTFIEKYRGDVALTQFMEQVLVCWMIGRENLDTIDDIVEEHNNLIVDRHEYIEMKQGPRAEIVGIVSLSVFVFLVLSYAYGTKSYVDLFSSRWYGILICTLYFLYMGLIYRVFRKYYEDDDIEGVDM